MPASQHDAPASVGTPPLDFDSCYRAVSGRDTRWDARIYLGVTSTGIYCRPSCPARTPLPQHCVFFRFAAACVAAGFRPCKRCRPDALPGTRDWDTRSDTVAQALRYIRDGAIDEIGVPGLAAKLAVSERHLRRIFAEEVGASPVQLARTRRAHAARTLIDETDLSFTDIAFAAGFGSLRQFHYTMQHEFRMTPSQLRRLRNHETRSAEITREADGFPTLALNVRTRAPFDAAAILAYLTTHAVTGRDEIRADGSTAHAIDVPGGTAVVTIAWQHIATPEQQATQAMLHVPVTFTLPSLSDVLPALQTVRFMLDLDADPAHINDALSADPVLAPLVRERPGLRLPGARNAAEFALWTVIGQQISVVAARTVQSRLTAHFAHENTVNVDPAFVAGVDVARVADCDVSTLRSTLGVTNTRAATLRTLATALLHGLSLSRSTDFTATRAQLLALHGIGPWTSELIALRALGDPDAYPAGDLILHRSLGASDAREAVRRAESWRPFRGYATQHLWAQFYADHARKDTQ